MRFFDAVFLDDLKPLKDVAPALDAFFANQAERYGDLSTEVTAKDRQHHVMIRVGVNTKVKFCTFPKYVDRHSNPDLQVKALVDALSTSLDEQQYRGVITKLFKFLIKENASTKGNFIKFQYEGLKSPTTRDRFFERIGNLLDIVRKVRTEHRDHGIQEDLATGEAVSESEWSEAELDAAVKAYITLREMELTGETTDKAETNRQLRTGTLAIRSQTSIEHVMQCISSVLADLCLPIVSAYLAPRTVDPIVGARLKQLLADAGLFRTEVYEPTADPDALDARVALLLHEPLDGIPPGIAQPQRVTGQTTAYLRDPLVKAWVLKAAGGQCEGCGTAAPFRTANGKPYLEVHHVVPLVDGGPDTHTNAIALCPNCHRRCHYSVDMEAFTGVLYERSPRLLRMSTRHY